MKCPNCGGENPEDHMFCAHCGVPRVPAAAEEIHVKPAIEKPPSPPRQARPSHALYKQKWFLATLIVVPLLCCVLVLAVAGVVLVQTGTISLSRSGDNILIGVPSRSNQADLYSLRLGEALNEGTLLAEDVHTSNMFLSYQEDGDYSPLGNYYYHFGGFVPGQKLLVIWYEDEDGDVNIQRYLLNQDAPLPIFNSNDGNGYGQVFNNGQNIFINQEVGGEERCYASINAERAQRITKGNDCGIIANGAYILTTRIDDNETTLSIMNLDGSEQVTLINAQQGVASYRFSYDGSRVAYVTGESEQQITLLNGRTGEVVTQGEPVYQVLSYSFADKGNNLLIIAENDEGELELYQLDDSGAALVASGIYLSAEISQDGNHIIYQVGDVDQDYTVSAYNVSTGQNSEIMQGNDLRISLASPLERVFITQQDDDELTIYSANQDGSDLVTLFSDHNAYLGTLVYYPDRSDLFVYVYNDNAENSLYYTPLDKSSGYYLFEEYTTLELRDVSPDKHWFLAITREDANDDPALMVINLQPNQAPRILDESEDDFSTAVFTSNSNQVIYTILTGYNPDDVEVRQVFVNGEGAPVTLYNETYLVDVQWTQIAPFQGIYFSEPMETISFCPGAPTINVGSTMEGLLPDSGEVCYRFINPADQILTFSVEADFDTIMTLYDRDGYLLDQDDDSGPGLNPRLVISLPTDGVYYLVVSTFDSGTGRYSLSMQEGISDTSLAIPLDSNVLIRDYINSTDAIYLESSDYATYGVLYYFDGMINEQIKIDVFANSQGSEIDPYIYLYNASMNILMTDDDSGAGYDAQINLTLPATGRYYILVEDLRKSYGPESSYWFDILLTR
jgi:Tol biopolymer transport system component